MYIHIHSYDPVSSAVRHLTIPTYNIQSTQMTETNSK